MAPPISPKWLPMYRWLASLPPNTATLAAWEVRQWVQQQWARLPLELRRTPLQRIVQYTVTAFHRIKHQGGLGIGDEQLMQGEGPLGEEEGVVRGESVRGRDVGRTRVVRRTREAGVRAEGLGYGRRGSGEGGNWEEQGDRVEGSEEDREGEEEVGEDRSGGGGYAGRRRRRGGRMARCTEQLKLGCNKSTNILAVLPGHLPHSRPPVEPIAPFTPQQPVKKRRAVGVAVGGEGAEAKGVKHMVEQQHCALVNHFNSLVLLQRHLLLLQSPCGEGRGEGPVDGGEGQAAGGSEGKAEEEARTQGRLGAAGREKRVKQEGVLGKEVCLEERGGGHEESGKGRAGGERVKEERAVVAGDEGKPSGEALKQGAEQRGGESGVERGDVVVGADLCAVPGGSHQAAGLKGNVGLQGNSDVKEGMLMGGVRRHEFVPPWKFPFSPRHCSEGKATLGLALCARSQMQGRTGAVLERRERGEAVRALGGREERWEDSSGPTATLESWVVCSVDYHGCHFKGGRGRPGASVGVRSDGGGIVSGGSGQSARGENEGGGEQQDGKGVDAGDWGRQGAKGDAPRGAEQRVQMGEASGVRRRGLGEQEAGQGAGETRDAVVGAAAWWGVSGAVRARECGRGYRRQAACGEGGGAGSRGRWMRAKSAQSYSAVWTGWGSLDNPRRGLGSVLCQSRADTWGPSWASYTSHAADAPTTNISDLAVQKVLDARFHPGGLPHLVIGCNEAPNELLLFDLSTGAHRPLQGHACQIQAVEYAMGGDVILSCGGSTLKVWDAKSTALLHSCGNRSPAFSHAHASAASAVVHASAAGGTSASGSSSGNPLIPFHRDKICALAVNQQLPHLAATSSGSSDPRIILWDVRSAKPLAHLCPSFTVSSSMLHGASSSRPRRLLPSPAARAAPTAAAPTAAVGTSGAGGAAGAGRVGTSARVRVRMAMDALCFADDRWLVCGSDTIGAAPSAVVLWDTSRPAASSPAPTAAAAAASAGPAVVHMPAFSSFVTCVGASPADPRTIIAGGGDGAVAVFDSRIHKAVARVSLGQGCEVTSAAFSPCGRFFHAACSANCCFVFDSRCLPSSSSCPPSSASSPSSPLCALFRLSHGLPVPSLQHSVQHAGCVDCGDEGVNDARWLSASPGLVTGSGNGSMAVWDVTLADPLTAVSFAHTRSINTVAVAPDDACIATGGDDQKVVLYLSPLTASPASTPWKLTHPLRLSPLLQ
ncbi:hypothetical protein CLOM_g2673 [Closterium sp. NIES-68]|nr:hypothetical protein CLOM_g2673 [Closterium sp. NIES-68]